MIFNEYRNRQKSVAIYAVLIFFLTITPWVNASEMTHGEMQAAIRSANFPCAQVINLEGSGDSWSVKCNSGSFRVTRDQNGKFAVSKVEE